MIPREVPEFPRRRTYVRHYMQRRRKEFADISYNKAKHGESLATLDMRLRTVDKKVMRFRLLRVSP